MAESIYVRTEWQVSIMPTFTFPATSLPDTYINGNGDDDNDHYYSDDSSCKKRCMNGLLEHAYI